jgi:hypothetical protein
MGFSLVVSLFALVVAGYLVRDVQRQESGTLGSRRKNGRAR